MKKILIPLANCLAAVPVAAIATFLLTPFWRWLEATTGLESAGHSGPSAWCFVGVYALALAISFTAWLLLKKSRGEACP